METLWDAKLTQADYFYLPVIFILALICYLRCKWHSDKRWSDTTLLKTQHYRVLDDLGKAHYLELNQALAKNQFTTSERIRKLASWFPTSKHLSQIHQQLQTFITSGRIQPIVVDFTEDLLYSLKTEPQETVHTQSIVLEIVRVDIPVPGPVFMGRHILGIAAIHPYNHIVLTCATNDHTVNHVINRMTKTQGYYPMEQYLKVLTREVARTAGV